MYQNSPFKHVLKNNPSKNALKYPMPFLDAAHEPAQIKDGADRKWHNWCPTNHLRWFRRLHCPGNKNQVLKSASLLFFVAKLLICNEFSIARHFLV